MMNIKKLDKADYKQLQDSDNDMEINQNHVILGFIDFDFNPDEITEKLELNPLSIARKGEEYFVGKRKVKKTWECNHWDYELKTITNDFIGETINDFFETVIEPRFEIIKDISSKSEITRLIIVQYYYTGCNPGYSLNKKEVKMLAEINAEIDIDIYCLNED